ncbi:MAG: GDSL-type esterase/lipase family protein [Bdellovibrionota bacterium]
MTNNSISKQGLLFKSLLAVALVATFSNDIQAQAQAEPVTAERLPASMGAIGDSMTAGALAMFKRQNFVLPWTELVVAIRAMAYGLTSNLSTIEARKLSWSSGYDTKGRVESHAYRISKIQDLKQSIPSYNAAVTGAESGDIQSQVDRMNQWSIKTVNKQFPDYVTLMIGPNDACANSPEEMVDTNTYYSNVVKIVDEMLAKSPDTKIVVGSIPNIELLRTVAKDARLYWGVKCEALWKKANLCPTLTTLSDPYQRAIVGNRIKDYNNALQEIVESRRASVGDRIRFAPQTFQEVFSADELSIDCFHPNTRGQQRVANATWDASWWTKEWKVKKADLVEKARKEKEAHCQTLDYSGKTPRRWPGC